MAKKIKVLLLILITSIFMVGCVVKGGNAIGDKLQNKVPASGGGQSTEIQPPKNDVVKFNVTFVTNGGSLVGNVDGIPLIGNIVSVSTIIESPKTFRDGYVFGGWYSTANFFDSLINFPYQPTRNSTFYAKWESSSTKIIKTPQDLQDIQDNLFGNYELGNDIDLANIKFSPIGEIETSGQVTQKSFYGVFDGKNYKIKNLTIYQDSADEKNFSTLGVGLFASSKGVIKNVSIENYLITLEGHLSFFKIGALVGSMQDGEISNCYVKGSLVNPESDAEDDSLLGGMLGTTIKTTKKTALGGMIGHADAGVITKAVSEGNIISESIDEDMYVGGLIGRNIGASIFESHAVCLVKGKVAGNLIGDNNGTIRNSYAEGATTAMTKYPTIAGGLVGQNNSNGKIFSSFATGSVTARIAGGLVGTNVTDKKQTSVAEIANCYAKGEVNGYQYAGGLVGRDIYSKISNSFAYGVVVAKAEKEYFTTFAGGLIGDSFESNIQNCIAVGNVLSVSTRPPQTIGETTLYYNQAIANNAIGSASSIMDEIYGYSKQLVRRNNNGYTRDDGIGVAKILTSENLNNVDNFLTINLQFDGAIWVLDGLDIEKGKVPLLRQ